MTALERRALPEVRAVGRRLEGYAARFGTEARIGNVVETIAPGAFDLAGDVLALWDHTATQVLGRTRSGTLRLTQDREGLAYSLDLPDTTAGQDVLALARRGDLGGMSIGFLTVDEHWTGNRRELRAIKLAEISVVSSWPAYSGTTIAVRRQAEEKTRPWSRARARCYLEAIR